MFRHSTRLKKRSQFLAVAARARKAPAPGLVLQALRRDDEAAARVGFTVTKKVGNSVVRNRARRRLREALRVVERDTSLAGVDLVLIGRDGTGRRRFTDLVEDLRRTLRKTGAVS
ncbi:ribonuclease P protein component [Acetobacter fallax]|uniref:Ribonuclease P protein component n=1 Tax=Acetobacter fallax TaxID=1737473 RepID=A0ABX0KAL8_9PROT|nr:ribonuclease P protein component [Acetobacter fallax]NHO31560.1 ribonuclease P protein component [Acetobacter fallax]NHO35119.1 ribonuclease P protein component [Acetobacter fallax]